MEPTVIVSIVAGVEGVNSWTVENAPKHRQSVLNIDVIICPGYDIAFDVAKMASDYGVTIAPHGCQELQIHLAAAVSHGEFLEYYPAEVDPLRSEAFYPSLRIDDDCFVTVPNRPGIGFDLNVDLLDRYRDE